MPAWLGVLFRQAGCVPIKCSWIPWLRVPALPTICWGFCVPYRSGGLPRGYFDQSISEGVQPYKAEGAHKPWMEAQCAVAEEHLTGVVRRAYFLCRFTGQRISDVIRLGETFIEDGGFRLSQKKTGRRIGEMVPD
jgi:hypothetical protein